MSKRRKSETERAVAIAADDIAHAVKMGEPQHWIERRLNGWLHFFKGKTV